MDVVMHNIVHLLHILNNGAHNGRLMLVFWYQLLDSKNTCAFLQPTLHVLTVLYA
jgi:hypothetical protein